MIINRPRSLHIRGSWQQRGHCTYHNSSSQSHPHRLHRCHHHLPPSSHHHLHYINSHQVIPIIISIATVIKHMGLLATQGHCALHSTYETGLCPRPDGHPPHYHPTPSSHKHCRPPTPHIRWIIKHLLCYCHPHHYHPPTLCHQPRPTTQQYCHTSHETKTNANSNKNTSTQTNTKSHQHCVNTRPHNNIASYLTQSTPTEKHKKRKENKHERQINKSTHSSRLTTS